MLFMDYLLLIPIHEFYYVYLFYYVYFTMQYQIAITEAIKKF